MIKKSRLTAVLLSAVFVASLIAGCGTSAGSDSTDTISETYSESSTDEDTSSSDDTASSDSDTESSSDSDEDTSDSESESKSGDLKPGDSFEITIGDYAGSTLTFLGCDVIEGSSRDEYKENHPDVSFDDSSELIGVTFMLKEPEASDNTENGAISEKKKITDDMSVNIDGGSILSEELRAGAGQRYIVLSAPQDTKSLELTYDNGTDKATFEVPLE